MLKTILATIGILWGFSFCVQAQSVTKAVVPFPAGGSNDSVARIVVQRYSELYPNESAIIENRTGANGLVGSKAVAGSAPDGRTWLFGEGALITVNPFLYAKDPDFDAARDLKIVASVGLQPSMLVVHPSGPSTLEQFVGLAKTKGVFYASAGAGSTAHLTMAYFGSIAGLKLVHVPYKGAPQSMVDVMGGRVLCTFALISAGLPHAKSGKLRPLAVSSKQRVHELPDVPTVKEFGYPNFELYSAIFIMVPSKTPGDITQSLEKRLARVVNDANVHQRLRTLAIEPANMSPSEAAEWLAVDKARWSKLIQEHDIKRQ